MEYGNRKSRENIKKERFAGRPCLEKIFKNFKNKNERNDLIFKAFKEYGYTQIEIGNYLDIHYASISRLIKDQKSKMLKYKT